MASDAPETTPRDRKFRQAAFVYLHVGLLYEFAVLALWRAGRIGAVPGHPLLWLAAGAALVAAVFWGLWSRRSAWLARAIWAVHGLRIPALIEGAFLRRAGEGALPPEFYLVALLVVLVNLWTLARAGWDL